jgi:hypothetical protein
MEEKSITIRLGSTTRRDYGTYNIVIKTALMHNQPITIQCISVNSAVLDYIAEVRHQVAAVDGVLIVSAQGGAKEALEEAGFSVEEVLCG